MKILGIETSCDETAVAIAEKNKNKIKILSNIVSSQINLHKKYGGVVPEVAAREHVGVILPAIDETLQKAGLNKKNAKDKLSGIAVACGPGLITSLIVGIETAKVLSYVWSVPAIAINHIEGHIYANFIDRQINDIELPAMALTVSGGHTMLFLLKKINNKKLVGATRDDAAGEAFDKSAQLLGLSYPGGPAIAAEAKKLKNQTFSIKPLPRPMIESKNFDFSFSGLKTALRYNLEKDKNWQIKIPQYAAEFQQAVVDVLISKTLKAAKKYKVKSILLSGGVSANLELRKQLKTQALKNNFRFHVPELTYTTDNAAMIATAGYFKAQKKEFTPWQKLKVNLKI